VGILIFRMLPLLRRRLAAALVLVLLAASVSFLPTLPERPLLWRLVRPEAGARRDRTEEPLVGIWGNALLMLKNLAPPFFPFARA